MADAATPLPPAPAAPAGERAWPELFRALRHRNFRLFLGGQLVSLVGTWMQSVAQSWLVYRLTHSEWLLGATWFCSQIPVFVLGPLGGLAADRYSRHRIVLVTQSAAMLQAFALAALTLGGWIRAGHVLVLAGVLGAINAFDMPGRQSLFIHMAGKEDLLNAISLNSAIFNVARMLGPALAGVLVARLGEGLCFALNGLSFVAVIASLLMMRLPAWQPRPRESPWGHLLDGFRYAHRTAPVRTLLGLVGLASLASMPAIVLMPFFADGIFRRGSQGVGFLMGAMGIGAVAGTLWLAGRGRTSGLPRVILSSSLMLGLGFVLFALSPSYYLSLALMPLVGFGVMRQNTSANTLIQSLIPDEYRGRIMALYAMMVVGLGPFGSLAAGGLAQVIGVRATVLAGGLVCLAAAFWFRLQRRAFRAMALVLALLAPAALAGPVQAAADESQVAVGELLGELERISGLRQRAPVRSERIARQRVQAFLEERLREEIKPEEIRAEEITLKKFGLLPRHFDLKKAMLELLSEQAAAFYDFRKKRLFLIEGAEGEAQLSALVHELAHALADQNFDLGRFIERGRPSDDGSLARLAVMEGQASWLMAEYFARRTGQSLKDSPVLVRMMSRAPELSAGQFPVFERAPLYLRETLLFPYTDGLLFQHAVYERLGAAAFREVFRRPPASTQQVLDPEKYLRDVRPARPPLPALRLGKGFRVLAEGTFGELDHAILLRQYAGRQEAESLAPRWRGGVYKLWERKADGRVVLAYCSQWEDEPAAAEYFRLYQRVLRGKWEDYQRSWEEGGELAGRSREGYFLLRREGCRVSSLEGLEGPPAGLHKPAQAADRF